MTVRSSRRSSRSSGRGGNKMVTYCRRGPIAGDSGLAETERARTSACRLGSLEPSGGSQSSCSFSRGRRWPKGLAHEASPWVEGCQSSRLVGRTTCGFVEGRCRSVSTNVQACPMIPSKRCSLVLLIALQVQAFDSMPVVCLFVSTPGFRGRSWLGHGGKHTSVHNA